LTPRPTLPRSCLPLQLSPPLPPLYTTGVSRRNHHHCSHITERHLPFCVSLPAHARTLSMVPSSKPITVVETTDTRWPLSSLAGMSTPSRHRPHSTRDTGWVVLAYGHMCAEAEWCDPQDPCLLRDDPLIASFHFVWISAPCPCPVRRLFRGNRTYDGRH